MDNTIEPSLNVDVATESTYTMLLLLPILPNALCYMTVNSKWGSTGGWSTGKVILKASSSELTVSQK